MNANHGMFFSRLCCLLRFRAALAREAQIAPDIGLRLLWRVSFFILMIFLYMPPRDAAPGAATGGRYPLKPIICMWFDCFGGLL
jgi:hypothetical protein